VIYVDDTMITSEAKTNEQVKSIFSKAFDMTDLGLLCHCLDVEVWQPDKIIFVSETKYGKSLLHKFKMTDCKTSSTAMEKGLKHSSKTDSKAVNKSVYKQ
jgi:hypothetical protein